MKKFSVIVFVAEHGRRRRPIPATKLSRKHDDSRRIILSNHAYFK